jgi:16S rRNA pseudouridine516 synthase
MRLEDLLYSQGFGTRRVCAGLVQQGLVTVGGEPVTDAGLDVQPEGLHFTVQGKAWEYQAPAYVMLHKPAGTECSQKPSTWPSIYTLLPAPLRQRPQKGAVQGVQAVGRLDQDTTGLLLLTDDGKFIHRMSSPRHHVPKVYEVTLKHPLDDRQVQRLLQGVVLDDDPKPVAAAACEASGRPPSAPDADRGQIPPGQAHGGGGGQPGGGAAPLAHRRPGAAGGLAARSVALAVRR